LELRAYRSQILKAEQTVLQRYAIVIEGAQSVTHFTLRHSRHAPFILVSNHVKKVENLRSNECREHGGEVGF